MAEKKKSARKYRRRKKKIDFKQGVVLILIAIFWFIAVFMVSSMGSIGEGLHNFLLGLFGFFSYIIPFVFLVYGFLILSEKSVDFKRLGYYISLIICLSSLIYLFNEKSFYNPDLSFFENLKLVYGYGGVLRGGVLGAFLSIPIINVLGFAITLILYFVWFAVTLFKMSDTIFDCVIDKVSDFSKWIVSKFTKDDEEVKQSAVDENGYIGKLNKEINFDEDFNKKIEDVKEDKNFGDSEMLFSDSEIDVIPVNDDEDFDERKISTGTQLAIEEVVKVADSKENLKENLKEKDDVSKEHVESKDYGNYKLPSVDLLKEPALRNTSNTKELKLTALKLEETLRSFGVEAKILNVSKGPTITRYELTPAVGVKVSKIIGLADDIALILAVSSIRIAPIDGKSAIGIEVPNKENDSVMLREIVDSSKFKLAKSNLSFAVGKNIAGDIVIGDIAKMPHVLIAGATGSGKSVCINTLITSILYKSGPDKVKFIMIDPKVVELGVYNGLPHLLIPVVTDPRKAAGALQWAVQEMVNRYNLFADKGVRDLKGYNEYLKKTGQDSILPEIVIIIDELSDLMMVAPNDVEDAICRLAQMARAAGMHLVVATQRPSVDVVTGVIKANIPSRIAFATSSQIDSRTILDSSGAEKLLGKGDMLYYPSGASKPIRLQGPFVSDGEIESIVDFIKGQTNGIKYDEDIMEKIDKSNVGAGGKMPGNSEDSVDPLLTTVIEMIVESGQASASIIQRKFKVGYNRAARMIDDIQERGIISGPEGSKPRKVLISKEDWDNMKEQGEI